ncbi:MAG: hypothetical protein ACYYK0_07975 [Candidatus Eutrophobiaceae bacterium]
MAHFALYRAVHRFRCMGVPFAHQEKRHRPSRLIPLLSELRSVAAAVMMR